ncbi:DUF72 domain-containing protein [Thermogladius sp. KZ2Tp1]|uniref:DUF72 domain-containing protein n=1 Tax=Thermogladius sp. KZ2Tp1 TaxID=3136289 RepID=UPI003DA91675
MVVKVGCCGFPKARKKYYESLSLVELQNTFYDLPTVEWAENLRSEAPRDFEFTVKAWQAITHPPTSPTWKRMKKRPRGDLANYGLLKPTKENLEALEETLRVAEALGAKVVVLQTPPSLPFNEESVRWVREFFSKAGEVSQGFVLGWEPRGEWAHSAELRRVVEEFGIVHVVDPFRNRPISERADVVYFRLHGIGPGEVNYRYKYTDSDLEKLKNIVSEYRDREVYVLFNNVYMFDDALRFKKVLHESGL